MYFLGKAVWDARAGFGGALLYQFLPLSGHHLSDGMSESLFVLWIACALLAAVWGVQSGRVRWFATCGLMTGLAYLTRPEGAIVLAAAGLALLAMQLRTDWRQPWPRLVGQGICLAAPAVLVGACYFVPVGRFTAKPSINNLVASAGHDGEAPAAASSRGALCADTFVDITSSRRRFMRGLWAFVIEVGYSLHYLGVVPLLIGLFWQGRALHRQRAAWIVTAYFCLHAAALLLLATSAGYLSDRHLMPLTMLLCYLVMIGLAQLGNWLAQRSALASMGPAAAAFALLALEIVCGLPHTAKRLHANRAGNHAAGLWLAERLQPGDLVLDDHDWSHYYAGQVFLERREPEVDANCRPTCYVVITRSNDPKVATIRKGWERRLQYSKSEIVYYWPIGRAEAEARIVIHALPRDPKTHPWLVAQK
jgi:4-amino-4-deoxy-L-arabinose transferase-like glycosyltransferase